MTGLDNWKDLLKIYCQWCSLEIQVAEWSPSPDLDYYGKKLSGNTKYWHSFCVERSIKIKNGEI